MLSSSKTILNFSFLASFIGNYYGVTAVFRELVPENFRLEYLQNENATWILGANYDRISKFDTEHRSKCGRESCYRKSLNEKKICTPGKLLL